MRKLLTVGFILFGTILRVTAAGEYKFIREIPISGAGGWDYLSIDSKARHLYVTHANKVVVVDLNNDTIAGEIADTPGVHGFAIAPELGRGFSSNGKENKVSVVDLKTNGTMAKVETGEVPDAILDEPERGEIYAFNGKGQSATVIDAKSDKVVATIPLEGKPEFAQSQGGRVFCNIEDKNEVIAIDTKTHSVVAKWPLAPGEEPTGMAIDAAHHRLFVGCDKLLVMLDSTTGKVIATAPIGAGVDACVFDDAAQLVFASCGDGTTTIAKAEGDKLNVVQTLPTERGARTMALDPVTHRIYLATAKFDENAKDERGRPKIIDSTLHVLIYGLER
ncbi:MAG: YVTN family beta-propeller domain-containing protein [Verrucomicrobia bacterium]|nr:MAG: YVTN family beta-propeller domain-containing protein [Verrucomicrobiota bacterium]